MSAPVFELPTPDAVDLPDSLPGWIRTHVHQYLTDPQAAHQWDASAAGVTNPVPTLLLLTRGRRSGKTLPLPLIYQEIDGQFVIIASKGGAPQHPAWYLNLEAEPHCALAVADKFMQAKAQLLKGAARKKAWAQMAETFPPYNSYRELAGKREIPVVALVPR